MAEQRFKIDLEHAGRGEENPEIAKVQDYLARYGYLRDSAEQSKVDAATSDAVATFQRFFGLDETGEVDRSTIEVMEQPRCGVPDTRTVDRVLDGAAAEFVLRGCKYEQQVLRYRFTNGTPDISGEDERTAVEKAFNTWADALFGMTFEETTSSDADFVIGWAAGAHGDGSSFDGIGNTLAHAFFPPPCGGSHAGDMHFDEAEKWSLTGSGGTFDTETVALHEIGHLLGLDHSQVTTAVMAPSYSGPRRTLSSDDIDGIRTLYPAA
ncbi:matrixin family metalloprotease [Streptomyces sp. NPDC053048]|uniref:matrixin family metalloprotease n=1 Tax=Streptomyces sp. NPDC053048 TaxID=3365694 RepID=UPI0037D77959